MTNNNNANPPPIQIPPAFIQDKLQFKFFNGLISTIYKLWTDVYNMRTRYKVNTLDASPTAVVRVPVAKDRTVMVIADIVGRQTNGSSAWYRLTGAYKNVGGTLTGIGSPNLISGEDQASWDFYFTNVGEEIVLVVVGAANSNISWEGSLLAHVVGA